MYRSQTSVSSRRWITHRGIPNDEDPIRRLVKFLLPTRWTVSKDEWARYHARLSKPRDPPNILSRIYKWIVRWWRPIRTEGNLNVYAAKGTSTTIEFLARFILAFLGGAALIVPMVIMVFDPSRTKGLITTSAAVLLFAFFISLASSASNQEVLGATATYAAVLVVFVSTSGVATS